MTRQQQRDAERTQRVFGFLSRWTRARYDATDRAFDNFTATFTTARLAGAPGGLHVEQQAEKAGLRLSSSHAR